MHRTLVSKFLLFYLCIAPFYTQAPQKSIDNLLGLSLEELMKVEVITASKNEQSIHQAPGIISVITSEEIKQFGGETLFEILDRMPSTISHIGHSFDVVAIRGGDFGPFSEKVSYLINGQQIRNLAGNGNYYNVLHSFPINRIKQIEMVRGPGSVLHGNNAVFGVINIVTDDNYEGIFVNQLIGEYNTRTTDITFGHKENKFNIQSGFTYSKSDGLPLYSDEREASSNGKLGSFKLNIPNENKSVNSLLRYKNFSFRHHYSKSERAINHIMNTKTLLSTYVPPDSNHTLLTYSSETSVYTFEYIHKFSNDINIELSHHTVDEEFFWFLGDIPVINSDGRKQIIESALNYSINKNSSLLAGMYYLNLINRKSSSITNGYDFDYYAYYAELKYSLSNTTTAYIGFQYNTPDGYSNAFVPRISITNNLTNKLTGKYSYSEAFRSPDPSQYLLDNVVTIDSVKLYIDKGNPNLKPELASTHDIQILFREKNYSISFTLFYTKLKDIIQWRPEDIVVDGDTVTYSNFRDNFGSLTNMGFEYEGKFDLSDNLFLTSSFVYHQNEYNSTIKNYSLAPNSQFKIGINYSKSTFSIASYLIASSAYKNIEGIRNEKSAIKYINPPVNAFYNLSTNIQVNINTLFSLQSFPQSTLSVYIRNILDYEHYQPDTYTFRFKSMPGMFGRNFSLKLSVDF